MSMNKQTVAGAYAEIASLRDDVSGLKAEQAASFARLFALMEGKTETVAPAPKAPAKADPKPATGKVYRSAAGKERAKVAVAKAWADAKTEAGVKKVSQLTPAQRAAVDTKVEAIWAAVPKTRTTKA